MIRILKHLFFVAGMAFIAVAFTNAYFVDQAAINNNSFTTSTGSASSIRLNEIYANPINDPPGSSNESNGEWVELYNNGDWAWDVNGWKLVDKENHTLVINSSKTNGPTIVPAHGWLVVNRNGDPDFSLNNGDEIIYLYSDTMASIDNFHYTNTTETKSWSRRPDGTGGWVGNQIPTPGATNG